MRAAWIVLAVHVLWLAGCRVMEAPVDIARNAVLISVDTLRADHLSVYGGPVPTPHVAALATEGVVVEDAFTPVPSTGPAMVSLLSGAHPWTHRVLLNAVPPPSEALPSLPETLQQEGFATGAFVASYVVSERYGFGRGFDVHHFEPTSGGGGRDRGPRAEDWFSRAGPVTDAALAWLDAGAGEPFFLWIHYMDPHDPYPPPPAFRRPDTEPVDLAHKRLPQSVPSFERLRRMIRDYRGSVAYVDHEIGRLLAGLDARGVLDRSAIVLTADHGEGLGDHGWLGHGRNLFDELVRVPLIVRAPGIAPGRLGEGAAQLEDLMPTLLSLLGVEAPQGIDGKDLAPWLRGEAARSPRDAVLGRRAAFDAEPALFYELREQRKWIGTLDGQGRVHWLDRDPEELSPLESTTLPEGLRRQGEALLSEREPRVLDAESREALGALGYLE